MRKGMMLVVALALGGCASVGDLEKRTPEFSEHTAKSADAYKRCVMQEWQSLYSSTTATDTDYGFRVVVPDPVADTDLVLVIRHAADGATVSLHERGSWLGGGKFKKTATSCL